MAATVERVALGTRLLNGETPTGQSKLTHKPHGLHQAGSNGSALSEGKTMTDRPPNRPAKPTAGGSGNEDAGTQRMYQRSPHTAMPTSRIAHDGSNVPTQASPMAWSQDDGEGLRERAYYQDSGDYYQGEDQPYPRQRDPDPGSIQNSNTDAPQRLSWLRSAPTYLLAAAAIAVLVAGGGLAYTLTGSSHESPAPAHRSVAPPAPQQNDNVSPAPPQDSPAVPIQAPAPEPAPAAPVPAPDDDSGPAPNVAPPPVVQQAPAPQQQQLPNGQQQSPNGPQLPNGQQQLPNGPQLPNGQQQLPNGPQLPNGQQQLPQKQESAQDTLCHPKRPPC
jgi:hypothetical protein